MIGYKRLNDNDDEKSAVRYKLVQVNANNSNKKPIIKIRSIKKTIASNKIPPGYPNKTKKTKTFSDIIQFQNKYVNFQNNKNYTDEDPRCRWNRMGLACPYFNRQNGRCYRSHCNPFVIHRQRTVFCRNWKHYGQCKYLLHAEDGSIMNCCPGEHGNFIKQTCIYWQIPRECPFGHCNYAHRE